MLRSVSTSLSWLYVFIAAPSPVQVLRLVVYSDNLTVTWDPPVMPNGVVSYNITLSGINLVDSSPIDITSNTATITDTMYTVAHSSIPYSNYTAVVVAFASAGASAERTVTEQTSEAGKDQYLYTHCRL